MRLAWLSIFLTYLAASDFSRAQSPAAATATNTIVTARAALDLPQDVADRGLPIRVKGVITCSDAKLNLCFVQDETAGIYIFGAAPAPTLGDLIEVTGVTGKGQFSPIVVADHIRVLGAAPLPQPTPVALDQLSSGRFDSQWVEVEGIVVRQSDDWGHSITLASGNSRVDIGIVAAQSAKIPNLVDARIKVRGVAATKYNERNQLTGFHLFTPNTNLVTIVEAPSADPFSAELRLSRNMMAYSRRGASEHRMRLRGVVTFYWPGRDFFIRDDAGGVRIESRETTPLAPGDVIDVVGFPSAGGLRPVLSEAVYRKVDKGAEPTPKSVTAKEAASAEHEGDVVTLTGKVLQSAEHHTSYTALVLENDGQIFRARFRDEWNLPNNFLVDGIVRVTGICTHNWDQQTAGGNFSILLRRPEDFEIITRPPAWKQRQMLLALGAVGGVIVFGFAWVILLRKRVQQQTAAIRKRETALEERYSDLFENANDIIYTHDIEGRILSMNNSGQASLGYTITDLTRMNLADLVDPVDLEKAREQTKRKLAGSAARTVYELRVRNKQGQRLTFEINSRLVMKDGAPVSVQGIARDITERKKADEALRLSESRLRASSEERERLARDLHDGLIQSVYAVGLNLDDCARIVDTDPSGVERRLRKAVADLNRVIREVRDFIMGLERHRLKPDEFKAALKSLALTTGETQSAKIEISIDDNAAAELTAAEVTQLLLIGREALANAVRHARAQKISLQLRRSGSSLIFEITDDGKGFNPGASEGGGFGLRNMASRAREMNAVFQIISQEGEGTRIVLDMARQTEEQSARENPFAHR